MARCGFAVGIGLTCDDQKRVGGVNKRAYVFNITSNSGAKVTYNTDASGFITTINFPDAYDGLQKFEGKKRSHSGGSDLMDTSGGNSLFKHDVLLKIFDTTPTDDEVIEDLASSDVAIILETNNNEFFLYGKENGMELKKAPQNTGVEGASDVTTTLTFEGQEKFRPKRVKRGSWEATAAYLETLVG